MAGIWCLHGHWRKNGHSHFPHQDVVYVHILSYPGFAHYYLYGAGILDEYQTIYPCRTKKSASLSLRPANKKPNHKHDRATVYILKKYYPFDFTSLAPEAFTAFTTALPL